MPTRQTLALFLAPLLIAAAAGAQESTTVKMGDALKAKAGGWDAVGRMAVVALFPEALKVNGDEIVARAVAGVTEAVVRDRIKSTIDSDRVAIEAATSAFHQYEVKTKA